MSQPSVFIGSSSEGLEIARAVRSLLSEDAQITMWNEGFFTLGSTFIETLVNSLSRFDFAILVLTPDDLVHSRETETLGPRDNVILELGLFLGCLGRGRSFVLHQAEAKLKLPTDLTGLMTATYIWPREDKSHKAAVLAACDSIREVIRDLGVAPVRASKQVEQVQSPITDTIARGVLSELPVTVQVARPTEATPGAARSQRVMYSYSHEDEFFKEELHTALAALRRQGLIDVWQDRQILPGSEFDEDIARALQGSEIIILLVSKYFIASDYCWSVEMTEAIRRHENGSATVVPIILKPADWKTSPFGKLKALPKDGKPIVEWQHPDSAWADIAEGIRRLVIARRTR
jgi:Predicted nucleotide-binding protein containing TIR-like domain/TIR domain